MPRLVQREADKKDVKKFREKYGTYLLDVVDRCEKEDESIRSEQVKKWKRADMYDHGQQYIFWNELIGDWDTVGPSGLRSGSLAGFEETRDQSGPLYDYVINVYKGHKES